MTLGSHQRSIGKSQEHLTPPFILNALGAFDLDPCAPKKQPWPTATTRYTKADDGLSHEWKGRVWLNPPFDRRIVGLFIEKLAAHGNGIALVHARTETSWFRPIWTASNAILFLPYRVRFHTIAGRLAKKDSGAPLVLAAFGRENADVLRVCGLGGAFLETTNVAWQERTP